MRKYLILLFLCVVGAAKAFETPTMGWSSWNTYRVNISDSLIKRQANAIIALGLDSAGYRYVNIDDGYFGGRDIESGKLKFHPQRFPEGLKPIVDHIHSLGLLAGIYSDAGRNTCGNFWDNDSLGLDVGLYEHDADDAQLFFNKLGFDYIKVDFCGGDERQNSQKLSLDPEERYRQIRLAIDSTGRKDVRMNICRWAYPGTWARDVAASWRTTADISPNWQSVKSIIEENLYLSAYAGEGHYNDMDMLEVGRGLTDEEDCTHFAMWCMMSSPLLIGCDLTQLKPATLALLKNRDLISINQDPAAQQAYVHRSDKGAYILVRDLIEPNGTTRAVALYNPTDSARIMKFNFHELLLDGIVSIRDMISRHDLGQLPSTETLNIPVAAHGTQIYRLTGERRRPRTLYEGETAFLPSYQETTNPIASGTAYYKADTQCSGGMCATMNGNISNILIWNNVYCDESGTYPVTIRCRADRPGNFLLQTNDDNSIRVNVIPMDKFEDITVEARLHKGINTITLSAQDTPLPDIDYMKIHL